MPALVACAPGSDPPPLAPAAPGTFRIVSSLPSKGLYHLDTQAVRHAIDGALASQPPNSAIKLEHVSLEGGSDETGEWTAAIEERNAQTGADDPSVVAYIGPHHSGAVAVALPVTGRAGLLISSPSATWPGLTQPGWDPDEPEKYYGGMRTFARLAPPDSYQAWAAANWVTEDERTNVLVLHDGSTYSAGLAREFATRVPGVAGQPAEVSTEGEQFQLPQLVGYDAVFVAPSSVQSAGRIATALEGSGLPVYSSDVALDPQFLDAAGSAASAWRIVSNDAAPPARQLAEFYSDAPTEVLGSRPALNAYVITRLVVEAVDAGHTERTDVLAYVRGRQLPGGAPLFDEAGDPTVWAMTGYRVSATGASFEAVRSFSR